MATGMRPVALYTAAAIPQSRCRDDAEPSCSYSCNNFKKSNNVKVRPVSKCGFYGRAVAILNLRCLRHPIPSQILASAKKNRAPMRALAEQVVSNVGDAEVELVMEEEAAEESVDYNWQTEWYPLYLVNEIPRDAPLALTVFDRPLVLFYDGEGTLNCLEDRCPHRLAKLSEGQIVDGRIECLYHGWQFQGDGICSKIPQLPLGAKIPRQACARSYAVRESQGVVWVWMADASAPDFGKLPWFEHYAKDTFGHISSIHELPYDYSILLENLLDPAHIPISHDRTDPTAKREDAQALEFAMVERSDRGFTGFWNRSRTPTAKVLTRFEAPCVIRSDNTFLDKDGSEQYFSSVLMCRPTGQGKSMGIFRFGFTNFNNRRSLLRFVPPWVLHITSCTVLEQDMGLLSTQNEALSQENVPTKDLYLTMSSQDTFVLELRKWMDRVGHGLPYYWGHRTQSPSPKLAVEENAPAGLFASASASYPSKGAFGSTFARDPTNRYYRHIVHCKSCRGALANFQKYQKVSLAVAALAAALAIVFSPNKAWRISLVAVALLSCAASWACTQAIATLTRNFFRPHRM